MLSLSVIAGLWACQAGSKTEVDSKTSWQLRDEHYHLKLPHDFEIAVSPERGGRVVDLSYQGRNMLSGHDIDSINYGSTLWISPQNLWRWPPPATLDREPYAVDLKGDTLQLSSKVDPKFKVQFIKKFWAETSDSSLVLDYTLINRADTAQSLALWEVSRMLKNGRFVALMEEDSTLRSIKPMNWQLSEQLLSLEVPAENDTTNKLYVNGRGSLFYRLDSLYLFKSFLNLETDEMPPTHQEVEFYIDDTAYVEVEQHSPYVRLSSDSAFSWRVYWYPRKFSDQVSEVELKTWLQRLSS